MSFFISAARLEDIKELVELEQKVFIPSDGVLGSRAFRYHIQKNKNLLLVARNTDAPQQLAGYILVLVHKRSARIYSLATDPAFQKQGIGRELVATAIEMVLNLGLEKITLELRKNNQGALRLYESMGFIVNGIRADYYQPGEDAIMMSLKK